MYKKLGWRGTIIVVVAICCYFGYLHFKGKSHLSNLVPQSSAAHPLKSEVHLTAEQVSSVMYREGIKLSPLVDSSNKYDLGDIHPSVFKVNNNKSQWLYIYEFPSYKDRKKVSDQIESMYNLTPFKNEKQSSTPTNIYREFSSWNVLFIQEVPIKEILKNNGKSTSKWVDLEYIVFRELNGGKTQIYSGENANWKATFTYNFYEHWWEDKKGILENDIGGTGEFVVTYKNQLPIKNVHISYQLPGQDGTLQSSQLTERTTKISASEMTQPLGTFEPKMTFNWDHNKSVLTLHLKKTTTKK